MTVFRNFVYEEKRQAFDSFVEQLFFLFKMRKNCFSYLNPAQIFFGNIADGISDKNHLTVCESDGCRDSTLKASGLNFGYGMAFILLQLPGNIIKVIADSEGSDFSAD